jgi:hypothetical protein
MRNALRDVIRENGQSPENLMTQWSSWIGATVKAWLDSGHLRTIVIEFYRPGASAASARWDFPWQQPHPRRQIQDWSLAAPRESSGCNVDIKPFDTSGDDLAVLVSITSNVEAAFAASRSGLPAFRAILHVKALGSYPHDISSPGQAVDIVALVVENLRRARDEFQARGTVHLFLAIPVGLAFLIGQSLNTAGPVQTYEHLQTDAVGRYAPAALLRQI